MIIKNIAPYPKEIKALKISLLPGQDADISQFSAKERQGCFELQEAFRKGEFICIGVGKHDREAPSVEARAQRAFSQGTHGRQPSTLYKTGSGSSGPLQREFDDSPEPLPLSEEVQVEQRLRYNQYHRETEQIESPTRGQQAFLGARSSQPLVKIRAEHIPSLKDAETTHRRHATPPDAKEQVKYARTGRGGVTHIDKTTGIVEQDAHGVRAIRPVEPIPTLPRAPAAPVEETPQLPTISRERARELIMASQCVGVRNNGRQCKRRPVTGYEYCVLHMPKEILEEYQRQKKQSFLKE